MSLSVLHEGDNRFLVTLKGRLKKAELDEAQSAADHAMRRIGRIRILLRLDRFEGWETGEDWNDLSFLLAHDRDIEKIAALGEEGWRDEVMMFLGAGMRTAEVKYFTPDESPLARAWIEI